jgi:nicotinate-nucleotide adenylyltransferase
VEADVVNDGPHAVGARSPEPAPARRRVALYGGSFDPPHNGHVLFATWVLCRVPIDELWLLPAAGHVFGKSLAPFATRCELITAAFSHLGPKVRIEPIEDKLPTPSYTIQTLRALTAQHPDIDFTLIMGSDVYLTRHKWREWDNVERIIDGRILVIGREGREGELALDDVSPSVNARGTVTLPDFSSTAVRNAIAAHADYWWMVPGPVMVLIEDRALYR